MAIAASESQAWSRRQFLARGSAAAGALALAGLAPARATAADAPNELTSEELAVLGALVSAILVSVGKPPSQASGVGLQSPETIARDVVSLGPDSRSAAAALLDAIDRAPSSGSFTSLSDAKRDVFMRHVLAPLAPPPPSAAQLAQLEDAAQEADADYTQFMAELEAGTLPDEIAQPSEPEAPDPPAGPPDTFPPTPPPPRDVLLANAVLAGLELVATPPAPAFSPPAAQPPSPELLASLAAWRCRACRVARCHRAWSTN